MAQMEEMSQAMIRSELWLYVLTNYGRPMEYGRPLYLCPVVSFIFYLTSFFPRLLSAVTDWISAILPHMVWL